MLISVTCTKTECENKGIEYLIAGNPATVECGGCQTFLEPVITDIPKPASHIYLEQIKEQ